MATHGIQIPSSGARTAGLVLLLVAGICHAQGAGSSSLTCPAAPFVSDRPIEKHVSCLVPVETVLRQHDQGKVMLVDVRDAESFSRYRIPGSLNIPLYAVKAKAFLRSESIVLVNQGHVTAALEVGCAELKRAGFSNVAVLQGGLRARLAGRGALEGEARSAHDLDHLMPAELFAERMRTDWLVLIFSNDQHASLRCWLPSRVEQVTGTGAPAIRAIKVAVDRARQAAPGLRVLAASDTEHAMLSALLKEAGVQDALYLESGLEGYQEFVSNQISIWGRQEKTRASSCCG
ncbi:rhodanese-like domain-containing protein [Cystobacter fuscus]